MEYGRLLSVVSEIVFSCCFVMVVLGAETANKLLRRDYAWWIIIVCWLMNK